VTTKRKERQITSVRRQDILTAAEKLFSEKGFKGTTTKELAANAGVHEAILFRHFTNKQELYRAAMETKLSRNRDTALDQMQKCAKQRDDHGFFEALARGLLNRFENDPSITRLILYSALDGHEPAKVAIERQLRVERPTLDYISKRIREGAFRKLDPQHAVMAFGAMLFGYIVRQQIVGMAAHKTYSREKIVKSFVGIFLDGVRGDSANLAPHK
jgi:TetR/AcrR family transcriptional regulator